MAGLMAESLVCDVLVVGGGFAATMAAITAAQCGASVVMLVKGGVGASGSSSRAGGVINASVADISEAQQREGVETHVADTLKVGCDLCSEPHVRAMAEEAPVGVLELERLGVLFSKDEQGRFAQLKLPGHTRPLGCSVIGGGFALMAHLRQQLLSLGVRVLEDTTAIRLLSTDNHVHGALAHNRSTGRNWTIHAAGTVIACGGATGLFRTVSGDHRNTGDGLILGYQAGAQLANLEFVEFTLIFQVGDTVLAIAGLAPFLSRGGVLVNRLGERVMERYYPPDVLQRAGRAEMLRAVVQEMAAGRAPLFIECSALTDDVWAEFERSQGTAILKPIRDAGADPRTDPIQVVPAAHSLLAGLVIDPDAATSMAGLWAAGESATGVHGAARLAGNGLAACLVFGRRAGRNAADFANLRKKTERPPVEQSPANLECLSATKASAAELRARISSVAECGLGIIRERSQLVDAEQQFQAIREQIAPAGRGSAPELSEVSHLSVLGELMASAALRREESRGLHFRADAAASKGAWLKWLVVEKIPGTSQPRWSYRNALATGRESCSSSASSLKRPSTF